MILAIFLSIIKLTSLVEFAAINYDKLRPKSLQFPVVHRDGCVSVAQTEEKTLPAEKEGTHHQHFRHHARQR
jgi:hypothetical protein